MKIISWNVNGLRSAFAKGLAEFVLREQPSILCLQETKIDQAKLSENEQLPGYSLLLSPAQKSGYSGVATYVRNDCPFGQVTEHRLAAGDPRFDSEGRFLITRHQGITLYNTYIPSGTTGEIRQTFKYVFLDFLLKHLQELSDSERARVVICGDFNICHRPIDIHHPEVATKRELSGFLPDERRWMDAFCELGFVDSFRAVHGDEPNQYTWWTFRAGARGKNLGWRIDYLFVAQSLAKYVTDAKIYAAVIGSDHCPISLTLSVPLPGTKAV